MTNPTRNATVPARFDTTQTSTPVRRLHAVIVGIDTYQDPQIRNLRFATADARSINNALIQTLAPNELNAIVLLNEDATLKCIRTAIGEQLARAARPDDLVLLYFAGHGAPELDDPVEPPNRYLIMHDTDYRHVFATALDLENDLPRLLQRIKATNIVVFIDSCFSGAAGGRTFRGPALHAFSKLRTGPLFLSDLDFGEGCVVISACKDDEVALEDPALSHGVLTYCLLQILQRDSPPDSTISVPVLYNQITSQVTERTNGAQTPTLKGDVRGQRIPYLVLTHG